MYKNKKITFIGDSITAGVVSNGDVKDRYSTLLCNELGAIEYNMGISGTILCTGHPTRKSRMDDFIKIPLDSDIVFILLGTNDFDAALPGYIELGEKNSNDTSTIYGAVNYMCHILNERFKDTKTQIYILTPIFQYGDVEGIKNNINGYNMRDLCKAYIDTCKKNNIICYDLNKYACLMENDIPDGLHPNPTGTKKIASALKEFLLLR